MSVVLLEGMDLITLPTLESGWLQGEALERRTKSSQVIAIRFGLKFNYGFVSAIGFCAVYTLHGQVTLHGSMSTQVVGFYFTYVYYIANI